MIQYLSTTFIPGCKHSEFIVTGDDREIFYRSMMDSTKLDMGEILSDSSVEGVKLIVFSIDRSKDEDRVCAYHVNGGWITSEIDGIDNA